MTDKNKTGLNGQGSDQQYVTDILTVVANSSRLVSCELAENQPIILSKQIHIIADTRIERN